MFTFEGPLELARPPPHVKVVAECGVAWGGDMTKMQQMIQASKDAGADAVKFQAFRVEELGNNTRTPELLSSSMTPAIARQSKAFADSIEIEWFCTPMYLDAVDWLNELGVKTFKIRELDSRQISADEQHVPSLIDKALATGKELYISAQLKPIGNIFLYHHPSIKWLFCVPLYPPRLDQIPLWQLKSYDGYSNHYPDITVPLTAAVMGAKIIEVHVTLDKQVPTPDQAVSFDFAELKRLCDMIRIVEKEQIEFPEG